MTDTLIAGSWFWTIGWALATGLAHSIRFRMFEFAIARYGLLPDRAIRPFAVAVVITLVSVGCLSIARPAIFAVPAGLVVASLFAAFASAEFLVYLRVRHNKWAISCGCLGGLISSELTALSWVLPAGIAVGSAFIVIRPSLRLPPSVSIAAIATDMLAAYLLVVAANGSAVLRHRRTWLSLMEARDG